MKGQTIQLFQAIVGSQSYGTSTPESDIDKKGVYMQSVEDLVSFGYIEQKDFGKDDTMWEVRRFMQLLQTANPTVLELLYSPEDCIIHTTPEFQLIQKNRDRFLTKKCLFSFGGYAVAQIKKAKGLDKKMNWEKQDVKRKTPLDFIYCHVDGKTVPLEKWLKREGYSQEHCGLAALNHFKECYALYYDLRAHYGNSTKRNEPSYGFRGVAIDSGNDIRLSSIPKGISPSVIIYYNKDGYSQHCKKFNEYQTWLNERNTARYVDIDNHGQKIDGKNMLHCRRLLDMAMEIATDKVITVRRPNAEYLLSIRKGEVPLEEIIQKAEEDLAKLEGIYKESGLPDDCDKDFVNDLLLEVRGMVMQPTAAPR